MFRDRVLRKIFGTKGELITGRELHAFYSPNYYLGDECWRMSWMRHVTCSAENKCVEGFGGGEPKGPGVGERVILKWILRKEVGLEGADWMNLARDRDKCWAFVNTAVDLPVS